MDGNDLRRLALSLPETEEKSHFGKADFRVRNRVFASLPAPDRGVVKLTPEEQRLLAESEPSVFSPVEGGWGLRGWTRISLSTADEATLESALRMGWRNAAPASLRRRYGET